MRDSSRARYGAAIAAGALALAIVAPAAAQDGVSEIGYVSPEPAQDFGWNEQGLAGAQAAADSVGGTVIQSDGAGYGDVVPILNQMAEDGADFVIAQASGYNTQAPAFAEETGIPVIVFDNPDLTSPGLVANVSTDAYEGGYLAGVLAASQTATGTLGLVLSANDVNWHKQAGGFVAGAKSVNPDIQFQQAQIDEFGYGDAEGGNRVTTQVIAAGADIIFGMGNGSSFGMLQAIENNVPEGAEKAYFIDVIGDKTSIDEQGVLLSSVLWDFTGTYEQAVADIDAGTFGEEGYTLNTANGGIGLLRTDLITDEAWAAVEAAAAGIADGSIEVPVAESQEAVDALISG
jgi:simple sugar transport system substrate-binding protein